MNDPEKIHWIFNRPFLKAALFLLLSFLLPTPKAYCRDEAVTIPLIAADYYGWAYTEAFMDKSYVYGWSTAGVDTLGWTILLTRKEYSGMFLVNVAGIAKTVYPVVQLLASSDSDIRNRAWIALGTHAATLISLELLGKPALSIQTMVPKNGGYGALLAFRF